MTRVNNCSVLILILTQLLLPFGDSASSSCQNKCGGIEIIYPFGIGVDCYLNKWYEIECRNNSTTFLSAVGKEVVHISLPVQSEHPSESFDSFGSVRIKNRITSKGCSSDEKEEATGSLLNLTGSPFYVGHRNNLVAVGCNITASLTNVEPSVLRCSTSCSTAHPSPRPTQNYLEFINCKLKTLDRYYTSTKCDATSIRKDTICSGTGCCQASIPDQLQQIVGVRIEENTTTSRGGCKVAFLTDEAYSFKQRSNPKNLYAKRYSLVELGWFIHTKNPVFIDSLECQHISERSGMVTDETKGDSCACYSSADSSYAICACNVGYRGNPYSPGGCRDIDECLENNNTEGHVPCSGYTCVNSPGRYKCFPVAKTKPIALGIGVGFGSLIFIGGVYWLYKFIKRQRKINRKKKFFRRNGGLLLQQQLISTEGNVEKTKVFSSKELEKATEDFSLNRILGQGGQGTVYKGMLEDGEIVAVKKSKVVDEDKLEEFINEVVILSQINHRNIVKLLGCCLETEVPVLVYEFIPNGNLFEHLQDEFDDYTVTTWEVRLRIAVDVSGALSYLHSAASSPIYHRDIKSTNIMLDEKYRAKVSDFGTSRSVTVDHTHLTTVVSGTVGYVDPEYFQSSQFTDKSDVYSFGVVLVELITGAKPISIMRSQENRTLATYFILSMKENKLHEIIDARIREGCKLEQVTEVAKLARKCLNLKGRKRPSMREVSIELERIRSSDGDSQPQVIVESDEEEETVGVSIGVESWNNMAVTDNVATSFLDAAPLFPRQTW